MMIYKKKTITPSIEFINNNISGSDYDDDYDDEEDEDKAIYGVQQQFAPSNVWDTNGKKVINKKTQFYGYSWGKRERRWSLRQSVQLLSAQSQ